MRQFYLENEFGQQFDLNNIETGFLVNPKGLGYKVSATYTKIGTAWKRRDIIDDQGSISADIVFGTSSPYESMQDMLKYVRRSSELVLHKITPAGEYLKDVDLLEMDITEIGEGNVLTVPVVFMARSLWYKAIDSVYQVSVETPGSQRYTSTYPSRYIDYSAGSVSVENDGSVPAPMRVVINGPVVDPIIILKQNGEELYRVEIDCEAQSGERIEWSSVDGDLFCEKVSALGVRTNLVSGFDIENANFFKAPIGVSEISFESDSSLTSTIIVTLFKQFRAV